MTSQFLLFCGGDLLNTRGKLNQSFTHLMLMINRYSPWHEAPLQNITTYGRLHSRTTATINLSSNRPQGYHTGLGLDKITKIKQ